MADFYDRLAHDGGLGDGIANIGWWEDGGHRSLVEHPRVVPSLRPRVEGRRCVEICTGPGANLGLLAAMGAAQVAGLDRSWAQLTAARAASRGARSLVHGDALRLPFARETADLVLCVEALGHLTDLAQVLEESAATLRPGGALVLIELLADPVLDLIEAVAPEVGLHRAEQVDLTDVVRGSLDVWGGRSHPFGPIFDYLDQRRDTWSYRLTAFERVDGPRPGPSRHRERLVAVSRWGARRTELLLREEGTG